MPEGPQHDKIKRCVGKIKGNYSESQKWAICTSSIKKGDDIEDISITGITKDGDAIVTSCSGEVEIPFDSMVDKEFNFDYEIEVLKYWELDDGSLVVAGEASSELLDKDEEVVDQESLKSTYVEYMKNPIVKFMHGKDYIKSAIGVVIPSFTDPDGVTHTTKFDKRPFLVVKVSAADDVKSIRTKIKEGILRGFSIGGTALRKVPVKIGNKLITKIFMKKWLETSIVDTPSNPAAFFSVVTKCSGCVPEIELVDDYTEIRKSIFDIMDRLSEKSEIIKGGKGSGVKGHKTFQPSKLNGKYLTMDLKQVKASLMEKGMMAGEVQELEAKHGENAVRAQLQMLETGRVVSYRK